MKKLQMQIDEELLAKIDDFARSMYLSRSAAITMILASHINQQQAALGLVSDAVAKALAEDKKNG